MKKYRIYVNLFFLALFLSFPMWAKFLTKNPLIFPPEDNPVEWLQFFATYVGAIGSIGMIYITARSIWLNKAELDEMKRQWKEEHKPEIIAYLTIHESYFYLCIKNTSRVPIHDIRVNLTHVPTKGIIPSKDYFLDKIDNSTFAIEAGGSRYINIYAMETSTPVQEDYLGLQLTYAGDKVYKVDLPFKEGSIIKDSLSSKQMRTDIHNISATLQQLQNKVK